MECWPQMRAPSRLCTDNVHVFTTALCNHRHRMRLAATRRASLRAACDSTVTGRQAASGADSGADSGAASGAAPAPAAGQRRAEAAAGTGRQPRTTRSPPGTPGLQHEDTALDRKAFLSAGKTKSLGNVCGNDRKRFNFKDMYVSLRIFKDNMYVSLRKTQNTSF